MSRLRLQLNQHLFYFWDEATVGRPPPQFSNTQLRPWGGFASGPPYTCQKEPFHRFFFGVVLRFSLCGFRVWFHFRCGSAVFTVWFYVFLCVAFVVSCSVWFCCFSCVVSCCSSCGFGVLLSCVCKLFVVSCFVAFALSVCCGKTAKAKQPRPHRQG